MNNKYCTCSKPKLIENEAYGKKFKVCAKSLGGCGEEYCESSKPKLSGLNATSSWEDDGGYYGTYHGTDWTFSDDDVPFLKTKPHSIVFEGYFDQCSENLIVSDYELKIKRR